MGDVISTDLKGAIGAPRVPRKRNFSPEVLAKFAENLRRLRADPVAEKRRMEAKRASFAARHIHIPGWVISSHRRTYREIARVLDEETAAQWARRAKAMIAA